MHRIPGSQELSSDEMQSLRHIVSKSFVSTHAVSPVGRARLIALGLVSSAMGGLMPTPAGKIVARL